MTTRSLCVLGVGAQRMRTGCTGDPEREARPWLRDYSLHVPLVGVVGASLDLVERAESDLVERAESDALLDSFSPGVRASLEGARLTQAEREEAEYGAFIEERMRRLSGRLAGWARGFGRWGAGQAARGPSSGDSMLKRSRKGNLLRDFAGLASKDRTCIAGNGRSQWPMRGRDNRSQRRLLDFKY
jgi:hypothetical protein